MQPLINMTPSFSPNQYGCQLWLDASNAASITSSAGKVSQWNDLSGLANHATQATGAKQPSTGTHTINSKNVITFGGAVYFENGTGNIITGQALSLFTVIRNTNNAIRCGIYSTRNNGDAGSWDFEVGVGNARSGSLAVATPANFLANTAASLITTNTPYAVCYNRTAAKVNSIYIDVTPRTLTLATNIDFVTNAAIKIIGGISSASSLLNGDIGELILYPYSLPDADILRVISYLKQKWGI